MKKRLPRSAPVRLALEPRIVFDAAIAASVADADSAHKPFHVAGEDRTHTTQTDPRTADNANHKTIDGRASNAPTQLIFIDSTAQDVQQYLQGVQGKVIVLDPNRDGVQQILDAMRGYRNITAIQILSHGDPGEVRIGSSVLNAQTLPGYASELARIGQHLSTNADVLIYGCNVAEGQGGQQFIDSLAQLTGANVAASTDYTGAASLGGNWTLEARTGPIDVKTLTAPEFDGLLGLVTTSPATVSISEDAPYSFDGSDASHTISISGASQPTDTVDVTLQVNHGVLKLGGSSTGNSTVHLFGGEAAINSYLTSLVYVPDSNYAGSDTLTINNGFSPVTVDINVTAAVAPVNTLPGVAWNTNEDTSVVLSGIGVTDTDSDGDTFVTTLSVHNGTLSVGGNDAAVSGDGSATLTLVGTEAQVNAKLAALAYTPTADYNGPDTLQMTTFDLQNMAAGVNGSNDIVIAPVADVVDDSLIADQGSPRTINVLANDKFAGSAQITAVAGAAHGTVTFVAGGASNGDVTYTPTDSAYLGPDSFTYTVESPAGTTETGTVAVTIIAESSPSLTAPSAITTPENTPWSFGNSVSFSDAANDISTVVVTAQVDSRDQGGDEIGFSRYDTLLSQTNDGTTATWTFIGTQSDLEATFANVTFNPPMDFNGSRSFTITATDANGQSTTSIVNVNVTPVDETPDVSVRVQEGTTIGLPVLVAPNSITTFANTGYYNYQMGVDTGFSDPAHGTVTSDGANLQVAMAPGFDGTDSFTYHVTTPYGETETATVTVTTYALPVVSAPGSVDTSYGSTFSFNNGNDVNVSDDGDLTSVSLSVDNGTLHVTKDPAATISAGANDSNTLTISGTQAAISATISSLQFTPGATFTPTATLSIDAADPDGHGTATVNIAISPVSLTAPSSLSLQEDQTYVFAPGQLGVADAQDQILDVTLSLTDGHFALSDPSLLGPSDSLTNLANGNGGMSLVGTAAHINSVLNSLQLTPAPDYNDAGTHPNSVVLSISVARDDGSVTLPGQNISVGISAVQDATDDHIKVSTGDTLIFNVLTGTHGATSDTFSNPLATIDNVDTSSLSGTLTQDATTGEFQFTPNAGFTGTTSFTYEVATGNIWDGEKFVATSFETATVTFNVKDGPTINVPPSATVLEDGSYSFNSTITVSDNPANNSETVTVSVAHGTLDVNTGIANGATLVGSNDAQTIVLTGSVDHIRNTLDTLAYSPDANYNGGDTLTIVETDNAALTDSGSVAITVTAVNDAPAGADKTVNTPENIAYVFSTSDFGFTDPSDAGSNSGANNLQAVEITAVATHGTLTDNGVAVTAGQFVSATDIAAGKLVFTPALNATGANYDSFDFKVQDDGGTANGGVDTATTANKITVNVAVPNAAPSGADKTVTTPEDTGYTFSAGDFGFSDTDGNSLLAVKIGTLPTNGTLLDNGVAVTAGQSIALADITGGKLVFTPAADANGAGYDTFTFQVQDNGGTANGGVDTDATPNTITVNVTAVNDAPTGADKTVTTAENISYTFSASDFGFADSHDSPANNLLAVEITAVPTNGTLMDNGVAVTAGQFVSVADVVGGKLVFTPAHNASGTNYDSFAFKVQDDGGTANGGVDTAKSASTITVDVTATVVPPNVAPSGADKTVTALEDNPYTFTTSDFGFTDTDGNALLAVEITTVPGQGTLMDNGVAVTAGQFVSAADIAAGKLIFTPASNANGAGYASFTFQVQDDGGTVNGGSDTAAAANTITVDVTSVNDAPTGTSKTVTTAENSTYTLQIADFGFSDVVDSPANSLLAVEITALPTHGTLTDNGAAVTAGQFISVADITGGKLVFTPAANASGTGYDSFNFKVQDDGGTANGGVDTAASANTLTIDVTATPNVPPTGADKTVTTPEDTGYAFTTSDFGFNDTDGNSLSDVEITTMPVQGALTDNGVAVTAGQFISAADIAGGKLVFTPAADANGNSYATFTFQVRDDGGTANGGLNVDPTPRTMTVDVTPVNDAPAGADKTVTTLEDTGYTFATSDFGFGDTHDSPANTLLAVKVGSLPTNGTLTDNGVAVTAGQFVSVADIAGGKLVFTPSADANGAGYASFTFQVQDDGGTANGGVDTTTASNTITIDVTPVNDAPTGADKTVTTAENTGYTFGASDFGFADAHDSPANSLLAVEITALPTNGTLTDSGVAVTAGQFVSVADITGGKLVFTPAPNATGANYDSFMFKAQDDGGTANGGVDTATSANTITVSVTATVAPNAAPSGADKTVTTLEDTGYTFSAGDFGFSDTDGNSLQAVKISALPTHGALTDNGVAVTAGQLVSVADITGGKLVFAPAADANGTAYASFTFQVQDNGGTANGGIDTDPTPNTITVNVTSVNDAPTGADKTVTIAENTGYTFSTSDFGFSDAHDSPANNLLAVQITALPVNGTLMDNGLAVTAGQFISVADITGGKLVFSPVPNASGNNYASFAFKVQDDGGTANGGVDTATSAKTITVDVTPTGGGGGTNHAPVVAAPAGPLLTAEDTSLVIHGVSVSDADNDLLTTTLTVNDGTISVGGNGGGVTGDGTATIVITGTGAQIDAKLAVLRYTPKSDWNGDDKLGIVVKDVFNASASGEVAIHVDDADVVNDALTTPENTSVSANVITGTNGASADIFEDPSRAITSVTQGAHGSVTFLADGTVVYTPELNFVGVDSFTYTVSANDGAVKTGTVMVNVTETDTGPTNPNPPANSLEGPWTTNEDVPIAIAGVSITGDLTDVLTSTVTVNHGTLSVGGNGDGVSGDGTGTLVITGTAAQINAKLVALGYKPVADYNGTDTLEISTKDGVTVTDFSSISVRPVADAVPDTLTTIENVAVTGNVLANDNFEGSPVVSGVTQGAHGQVTIGAGGNVVYTPAAGYLGADSFTYTVTSPAGVTETSTVNVQVSAVDPSPARGDTDPHLVYAAAPSVQRAADGKVLETRNLVYVQPVVRHEPLPTDSIAPVETEIHAVQKEAALLGIEIDKASTPQLASPLFDAFGLSAPRTEFVSPVQRASEEAAKDKTSQADTEKAHIAATEKPATGKPATRMALTEVKTARRAAPSFAAQLRRGNEMLRAAPRPDRSRP